MRAIGIVMVLCALWAGGTDLLNEDYANGTTTDLSSWNGPKNLAMEMTMAGDDSGNNFGVYTGDLGDLGEGSPVATWDTAMPNGAPNWGIWDSDSQAWSVGNGWFSGSGEPWAGYWSDGVNRTIQTRHEAAGLDLNQTVIILEYTAWANAAQNGGTYKALIHLTDASGIPGLEFQSTFRANAGSAPSANRVRVRRMKAPGIDENVTDDILGNGDWPGHYTPPISEENKTDILGSYLGFQAVIRMGAAGTGDGNIEARAAGQAFGDTAWRDLEVFGLIGQDSTEGGVTGIEDFNRVFMSALKPTADPLVVLDGVVSGQQQVGFGSIRLAQYHGADVDISGIVDNGDLLRVLAHLDDTLLHVWVEGDVDNSTAVEAADFEAVQGAWGSGFAGDAPRAAVDAPPILVTGGDSAELIYDPETGNVKLKTAGTMLGFVLKNNEGEGAFDPAVVTLPFDEATDVGETATKLEVSNTDLSMAGFTGTTDLGNFMPVGLDEAGVAALLTYAYFVGTQGGEVAFTIALPATGVVFRRGDSNRDGAMNIADGIYILQNLFASGPAILCPDAADANDDEGVNIADAIYILQNLFASGPAVPPPHPGCGPDETGPAEGSPELGPCDYCAEACQEPPTACQ